MLNQSSRNMLKDNLKEIYGKNNDLALKFPQTVNTFVKFSF